MDRKMRHLKKYNESKSQIDAEFFNSVFPEFLDNDKVECEYVDGTYWEIHTNTRHKKSG